jgi:hypothetical protein
VVVVAHYLLGWAWVEYRQFGEALLDTPHLEADPSPGPLGFSLQTVLKRPANRLGQGLTGRSREGPSQTVGFWILDADGHFHAL